MNDAAPNGVSESRRKPSASPSSVRGCPRRWPISQHRLRSTVLGGVRCYQSPIIDA